MIGLLMLAAAGNARVVTVTVAGSATCQLKIDGKPTPESEVEAALKIRRATASQALVRYDPYTTWRCMGGAMTAVSRAGYRKVRYDPPFPKDKRPPE